MTASLNRNLAWRTLILVILMAWPLILFGRPSYIPDSVSYLKGGKVAVEFATARLFPAPPPVKAPAAADRSHSPDAARDNEAPKAARSILYSVTAYLLRWPGLDMTLLAVAQLVMAGFIAAVVTVASGVATWGRFLAVGVVVAFGTTLAPFSALAVPDVQTGFVIAILVLVIMANDRLSVGVRLVLAAITAFSVTSHSSIPPLAVGMVLVGTGVWLVRKHVGLSHVRPAWVWLIAPTALGIAATAAAGFVAFGEVSVAAKRFPFALTRSAADGPARWYLEKHCATAKYAVCEVFGTNIPVGTNEFLFDKTGLNGIATPEQMDRIRAEETEIVLRAALAYPGVELYNLSRKIAQQMVKFDLGNTRFQERVTVDKWGTPYLETSPRGDARTIAVLEVMTIFVLVLSLGWLIWNFRRLDNGERATMLLVFAGLLGNATICVVFSGMADRYQARVIWLLPLFILSIAAARGWRGQLPKV